MLPLNLLVFLKSPKVWGTALFLIIAAVVLTSCYGQGRKAGREAEAKRTAPVIADLRQGLAECKLTVKEQTGALKAQNDAISQLQEDAAERAKAADAALRQVQQEARKYRDRAEKIAKAEPSSPDLCKSADLLIRGTIAEERR